MLIVYEGPKETLVVEKKNEEKFLSLYFTVYDGRVLGDYKRVECKGETGRECAVAIGTDVHFL